jgi:dipeptidyl aminopeptidase/acylaminoacyl peptidase
VAVAYVAWAALQDDPAPPARPTDSALSLATAEKPFLVYQHVARDEHYAEVAVVPLSRPDAAPTFTGLVCERVYFAARRGLCLMPKQEPLGAAVRARVVGLDFRPLHTARLDGILSRARVSPSGRYGATTTFVTGHSYRDQGFSTNTSLLDMVGGKVLADLEDFEVTKDGKPFDAIDFNFWGVTFAAGDQRFYATLQTAGDLYLVEGDLETKKARVVGEDVECPSLSPDGRRIAFKLREGNSWRLHVLDLASGRKTPLAETRSVDDQVEWLDGGRILYGLTGDLWVVQADGRGRPRVYRHDALSPAVVRA